MVEIHPRVDTALLGRLMDEVSKFGVTPVLTKN